MAVIGNLIGLNVKSGGAGRRFFVKDSLDGNETRVHCRARLMSLTLTTDLLTRNTAGVVIVPRDCRMGWPVAINYSTTGKQEEQG
jgi:hypothetical protein